MSYMNEALALQIVKDYAEANELSKYDAARDMIEIIADYGLTGPKDEDYRETFEEVLDCFEMTYDNAYELTILINIAKKWENS